MAYKESPEIEPSRLDFKQQRCLDLSICEAHYRLLPTTATKAPQPLRIFMAAIA
jgi:hypothetical protein